MIYIYVLECVNNKYYVSQTAHPNIEDRLLEHLNQHNTCEFTKMYEPLHVLDVIETNDAALEDVITKKYMMQYGIANVRGGSYSNIELLDYQIKALDAEFKAANTQCTKCGVKGHPDVDCDIELKDYLAQFVTLNELKTEITNVQSLLNKYLCWMQFLNMSAGIKKEFLSVCQEFDKLTLEYYTLQNRVKNSIPINEKYGDKRDELGSQLQKIIFVPKQVPVVPVVVAAVANKNPIGMGKLDKKIGYLDMFDPIELFEPAQQNQYANNSIVNITKPDDLFELYQQIVIMSKPYSINLKAEDFNVNLRFNSKNIVLHILDLKFKIHLEMKSVLKAYPNFSHTYATKMIDGLYNKKWQLINAMTDK